jgi:hypothetical protein
VVERALEIATSLSAHLQGLHDIGHVCKNYDFFNSVLINRVQSTQSQTPSSY